MKSLRTPDERFAGLADFPYEPNYVTIDDLDGGELRVHYVDAGPADGNIVLLMHGEPTWSYLYRHMIPVLVGAGYRVIAPDLIGFGRSDKPSEQSDYTYARHVEWMKQAIIGELDLANVTLFAQDWGGLIGLRLVAAYPERFDRVIIGNTGLPTGHATPSDAFLQWQSFSQNAPEFPIGQLINGGTVNDLSAETIAAYDAPFPDDSYKAGARIFPALVPTSPDDPESAANVQAWKELERFEKPFRLAFSDSDPITGGGDKPFREKIPGAADQPHVTIERGGHFLQEDQGPMLAINICEFISQTS